MRERDELILAAASGGRPNATGWVRVNCPLCHERKGSPDTRGSLGYLPSSGGFRCFRCDASGKVRGVDYAPEVEREETGVDLSDREFMFSIEQEWGAESLRAAVTYLRRRGFTKEHIFRADMHVDIRRDRVVVPHMHRNGEWWGYSARTYVDGFPKLLYPPGMDRSMMFNEHVLFVETDTPVMVVEGCLDSVWYLPDVVACLGKPTAAHFDTLCEATRPVVVCLDGDAWEEGRALAQRLQLRGSTRASYVRLPPGEDPNSIDPSWLQTIVAQTQG